ncbi:hypothetical protein [Phenylobacterium sp.]|uniref:hypothetical protein n=1 Tax=Phenylobacterium sp. TaxID=1871053 RepID=UPI002730CE44|nr:hypothetical protein [Phenylobacterium sp.]MDP1618873.1 hypothetical protein [Phenylobacterium sp.]
MTEDQTPAEALASISAARTAVGGRVDEKSWTYDLIYSSLAAVMIGAHAFPSPIGVLGSVFGIVGLALLVRTWADRTGVLISGLKPPRARWVSVGLGLVLVAVIFSVIAGRQLELWWVPLPLAAITFVAALVASRLWRRVYRAEMGVR